MRRIYTDEWEAHWQGHHIVVRTWIDSLFRGGEDIFIDGASVPNGNRKSWRPRRSSDFRHTLIVDGQKRELDVHVGRLAQSVGGRKDPGCLILVDGVPIGGDVGREFKTIEPVAAPDPGFVGAHRNLLEEASSRPPGSHPWWVRGYSWLVSHPLRGLMILMFVAWAIWKALFDA